MAQEKDAKNREILRIHGLRSEASGDILAQLADWAGVYPPREVAYTHPSVTFEPFYFFFYGSLQVPSILKRVCRLDEEPELKPASIKGWKSMKWSCYPALVPKEDGVVKGMCWKCEKGVQVHRLALYESDAYRMAECKITTDDGEVIENGRIFVSTLDVDELDEGEFDLEAFVNDRFW
ncbi:uncharacterized protein F4822DRAFT_385848 [Hypoxylon trugodes]|uniref:uncharacterized protein n=1 Tax=Hypoxylon trugodes TaxID=326681 RepID=UPI002196F738|nr:uncharacterized protein F4822DRAFT_385848 [Hypoxylon trugodes]KAI1393786.1 hypothetical protein F4822DRAFT_385848 [Hypoxylon trugodes]